MSAARSYRILNVFNRYRFFGGEESCVERIHQELSRRHQMRWCTFESRDWSGPGAPGPWAQVRQLFYNPASRRTFEAALDEFQPDVALFHNIFPVGSPSLYHAATLRRLPIIQMVHNFRPFSVGGTLMVKGRFTPEALQGNYWREVAGGAWQGSVIKSAIFALVLKRLHRSGWLDSVKRWLCISNFMRNKFSETGVTDERLVTLRHSWDAVPEKSQPEDGGYYLFLGRLVELKGIHVLLDAWRSIEQQLGPRAPELHLGGEGPLESVIREAAARSPKIKFLGMLGGEIKVEAIRRCRAMLAPSIWWEPLGLVTYEAYESSKPMLAAASGGLTETVIHGETGFLHAPGNAGALTEDVLKLEAMSSAEREAMGRAGRSWLVKNADPQVWMSRFEEMVEGALSIRSRGA